MYYNCSPDNHLGSLSLSLSKLQTVGDVLSSNQFVLERSTIESDKCVDKFNIFSNNLLPTNPILGLKDLCAAKQY